MLPKWLEHLNWSYRSDRCRTNRQSPTIPNTCQSVYPSTQLLDVITCSGTWPLLYRSVFAYGQVIIDADVCSRKGSSAPSLLDPWPTPSPVRQSEVISGAATSLGMFIIGTMHYAYYGRVRCQMVARHISRRPRLWMIGEAVRKIWNSTTGEAPHFAFIRQHRPLRSKCTGLALLASQQPAMRLEIFQILTTRGMTAHRCRCRIAEHALSPNRQST
jgi:hypothetical protein